MARLPIRERIKRKRRIVALFRWRMMWEVYSQMWLCTNLALLYSLGRLAADGTPTTLARRDVTNFFSAQDCVNFLRFTQTQIMILLDVLGVPDIIRTDCGFVVSGREALCVLLYRLAFPCRLKDMRLVFGLSDSCICEAFNYMIHFLDSTWGSLLDLDVGRLGSKLEGFAKALVDIGCPMSNIWGFIDGTVRGTARPKRHQRIYYNGHKRKHAVKFQGVVTPDGLFVHLFGPIVGSRHDNFLLSESGLLSKLETHMNTASGEPFCLYGDPAYNTCPHLSAPFSETRHGPLTPEMIEFNYRMSACRVTVEWGFKEMTSKWAFVAMKPQQKVLLSAVGKQHRVATLLSNFHSCLNGGNEISQFFGVPPPSLEEYLGVDAL